ncbi:MAG: dihydroorotase [Acidimicrobiia bacterium]|nr:dihydroorotase [Acidimicrobiia bacterium]
MTVLSDVLIKGGTIVDARGERPADVLIGPDGRIAAVGLGLAASRTLDAGGCIVAPGLVEVAAQLGEPGREGTETIETATRAAALGGFTAVVARPDTDPAIDNAGVVREIDALARSALCQVACSATVTVGGVGHGRLSPLAELAALGVRLFVDEGVGTQDPRLLRRALEYASDLNVIIGQHPEDSSLARGGFMHEGAWSSRLGLAGIPAEAEELAVMRDIALARLTGSALHFRRLTTEGSLAMVKAARRAGLGITVEAAVQHAVLTDAALADYDPMAVFRPPLRPESDRAALVVALADGAVDVLSADHSPQAPEDKEAPVDSCAPGAIGLETVLALAISRLDLPMTKLLQLLSWRPAALVGLQGEQGGPLEEGRLANICVIDPNAEWSYDPRAGASRGRNSPFAGWKLRGRVRHTVFRGEPVVVDGKAQR